jgi:hypothetical protein
VASSLCEEGARADLFTPVKTSNGWFSRFTQSFNQSLLLDRHYLHDLEQNMCIASLPSETREGLETVDSLRVLLARRFGSGLVMRELPVSLLRLYFSGQHHFHTIMRRLTHPAFYHLHAMAVADGFHPRLPTPTPNHEDGLFQKRRSLLTLYLARLLDLTFCSFERCLATLLYGEEWLEGDLFTALREDPYWKGLPLPPSFPTTRNRMKAWRSTHSIWYAVVWRMNVTLLVEKWLKPWDNDTTKEWLLYRMQLFRDTHLDLLTVIVKEGLYQDAQLMAEHILGTHYPAANRVCCAEELPDMLPYALDNFKSGTHLKERSTLQEKIGHLNVIKRFNNICKDRNDWDIIRAYGEQDPVVYDHLKYTIRCVMLGNVPGARGTLTAVARVRVNLSFWPEYADRVMTREEIDTYMHPYCNPYCVLAQRREQKVRKETEKGRGVDAAVSSERVRRVMVAWDAKERVKMTYEKTCFKMWLIKCRYYVSSLLKEMLFYIQESNGLVDRYLALDFKWLQYKQIIRLANGQCRNELSKQAGERPLTEPFDWKVIEFIEKSPDAKYDIKRGKIMAFHNVALKVAKKVLKRNFIGIVEVKATGIEERILLDKSRPLEPIVLEAPDGGALKAEELLDFICYCMGTQESPILQSSLFQVMGMSRAGLQELRQWLLFYYGYDIADDSLKDEIEAFECANPRDYFILKTAFRLIQFHRRREHTFYLPAPFAMRQLDALRRRQLAICDWEQTPPELGIHYRCHGCQKFANGIVKPANYPRHSNHTELVYERHQVYAPRPACEEDEEESNNLSLRYAGGRPRTLALHTREYALDFITRSEKGKKRKKRKKRKPVVEEGVEGEEEEEEEDDEDEEEEKKPTISFLNVAFYNIYDGKAYCVRNRRRRIAGGVWSAVDCEKQVIMSSGDGLITVSCNRVPVERGVGEELSEQDQATTTRKGQRRRGRRAAEESDEESESEVEEGEERRPEDEDEDTTEGAAHPVYETALMDLFTDLRHVNRSNRESLEQFAKQRARELAQNMAPTGKGKKATKALPVENNKKRIMSMVQTPIKALYNCQVPLQQIDMVGKVQNGKVLCVECGCMTEYRNHAMTHYGPVCMRHLSSTMQVTHPAWKTDAFTAQYVGQQERQQQAKFRRHPLHPWAVLQPRPSQPCRVCGLAPAEVRITVREAHYGLRPVGCCGVCHHNMRPLLGKQYLTPLRALVQFAETRRYRHSL